VDTACSGLLVPENSYRRHNKLAVLLWVHIRLVRSTFASCSGKFSLADLSRKDPKREP
jgi:hypothetical protein